MILPAFRRNTHSRNIHALYGMIVAQARLPVFYTGYAVPDSVEGRFEMIALHLVLILRQLGRWRERKADSLLGGRRGAAIGQRLFDLFCRDLDHNLREMGVGDLAVPRRMRQFGEAFYGRQAAYLAALDAADERALENALARNIFCATRAEGRAVRLARYVRAVASQLDGEEEDILVAGQVVFTNPVALSDA
jgi:cytochrome b pre-mRNA-processing protein 3